MPYVNIKITNEGVTKEQKAELVAGTTELLKRILKNGKIHNGKQNHKYRRCGRQFV